MSCNSYSNCVYFGVVMFVCNICVEVPSTNLETVRLGKAVCWLPFSRSLGPLRSLLPFRELSDNDERIPHICKKARE